MVTPAEREAFEKFSKGEISCRKAHSMSGIGYFGDFIVKYFAAGYSEPVSHSGEIEKEYSRFYEFLAANNLCIEENNQNKAADKVNCCGENSENQGKEE